MALTHVLVHSKETLAQHRRRSPGLLSSKAKLRTFVVSWTVQTHVLLSSKANSAQRSQSARTSTEPTDVSRTSKVNSLPHKASRATSMEPTGASQSSKPN